MFIYAKFLESRIHVARFIGSVRDLFLTTTYTVKSMETGIQTLKNKVM